MYKVIPEGSGVVLFILKVPELVAIKTADPILGAKPKIALVILRNSTHGTGGQPFRYGVVPEAYLLPISLIAQEDQAVKNHSFHPLIFPFILLHGTLHECPVFIYTDF
jgi:hypothetical protein